MDPLSKTLSDTEISDPEDDDSEDDFEDLQSAYDALIVEYSKVKKQRLSQHTRNCKLRSERDSLKTENEELTGKISKLESDKSSETNSAEKFKEKLEEKNKKIDELEKVVEELQDEIGKLKEKIKGDEKIIERMNSSSQKFEEIWSQQRTHGDKAGLGYTGEKNTLGSSSSAPSVAAKVVPKPTANLKSFPKPAALLKKSLGKNEHHQHPPPKVKGTQFFKSQPFVPTCHHCGIKGHIRPNCHKLHGFPLNYVKNFSKGQNHRVSRANRFQGFKNSFQKSFAKPRQFSNRKYEKFSKSKDSNFYERREKNKNFDENIFPKIRTVWVRKSDLNVVYTPKNVEGVSFVK